MTRREINKLINDLPEAKRCEVSRKIYNRVNAERKKVPGAFMNLSKMRFTNIMVECYEEE